VATVSLGARTRRQTHASYTVGKGEVAALQRRVRVRTLCRTKGCRMYVTVHNSQNHQPGDTACRAIATPSLSMLV
jgi:hypothetical protein